MMRKRLRFADFFLRSLRWLHALLCCTSMSQASVCYDVVQECVNVLMNPKSHTTILGPAAEIEVLESTKDRQVRRAYRSIGGTSLLRPFFLCVPGQWR